jgi:hypothetical protein
MAPILIWIMVSILIVIEKGIDGFDINIDNDVMITILSDFGPIFGEICVFA